MPNDRSHVALLDSYQICEQRMISTTISAVDAVLCSQCQALDKWFVRIVLGLREPDRLSI